MVYLPFYYWDMLSYTADGITKWMSRWNDNGKTTKFSNMGIVRSFNYSIKADVVKQNNDVPPLG